MKIHDLIIINGTIHRVLAIRDKLLVIDCEKRSMPYFIPAVDYETADGVFCQQDNKLEELTPQNRKIALNRYTIIAPALAVMDDPNMRSRAVTSSAERYHISKQTVRSYLWRYLVFQDIGVLAPKQSGQNRELTDIQKIMRWSLNKFFYTQNKNSLPAAYQMMLKAKFRDGEGNLEKGYPTFNQFRYFYRKTRNIENFYISRNGIKDYQRNNRPLVGDGVQDFAPNLGTAMLDGTICDIYLVDDAGNLVGRPILVSAVDANTSLCLGYSLQWEGGTYSLIQLMQNIITDKVELCKKFGIIIRKEQWNVSSLPGIMVTDRGSEYIGQNFGQITELGVTLQSLPSYRADLKGPVEKLFSLIQDSFKDSLKNKGVIMPDWQERGSHDYRKDACLTVKEFERIVVRCIVYYNSQRIIENYPYTEEMLSDNIKPHASDFWNYKINEPGTNLIHVTGEQLSVILLPRTNGRFSRFGLKVNKMRYYCDGYKEQYLSGGEATVAYNPDNCSRVWLREKDGRFVEFRLIESRFRDMTVEEADEVQKKQKALIQSELENNLKAKIELMDFIESVSAKEVKAVKIKNVRKTRVAQKKKNHKDIGETING